MPRAVPYTVSIATLVLASVALVGAPASAVYTPNGTMTFTAVAGTYEGDGAAMGGFCPVDTVSVAITSTPSAGVTIPPTDYRGAGGGDPALEGYFDTVGSYTVDPLVVPPGSDVTFQAQCLDGASAVLASATSTVTTFSTGATLSAPASAQIGSTLALSGTCPDPDSVFVAVDLDSDALGGLDSTGQAIAPGPWTSSFVLTQSGLTAGDTLTVTASCTDPGVPATQSVRVARVVLTAAPVAPPTGPSLPDTGPDATPGIALAGILLAGGLTLLTVGRARHRAELAS
jgi:LPXTG-motif cell wall-anchored protein